MLLFFNRKATKVADAAIDIGGANTVAAAADGAILFDEPTCVAMEARSGNAVLCGYHAMTMSEEEKRARGVTIIYPVVQGRIMNPTALHHYLAHVLQAVAEQGRKNRVVAFPLSQASSPRDRELMLTLAKSLGIQVAHFISEVHAATVHNASTVGDGQPVAILDMGADLTFFGLTLEGKILKSQVFELGGRTLDRGLCRAIRDKQGLALSLSQAESLRATLGLRGFREVGLRAEVLGVEKLPSMDTSLQISAFDLAKMVQTQTRPLLNPLKSILQRLPEKIQGQLLDDGIFLSGGCAAMPDFSDILTASTGFPFFAQKSPARVIALGAAKMILSS